MRLALIHLCGRLPLCVAILVTDLPDFQKTDYAELDLSEIGLEHDPHYTDFRELLPGAKDWQLFEADFASALSAKSCLFGANSAIDSRLTRYLTFRT